MRQTIKAAAIAYVTYLALSILVLLPALNFLAPSLARDYLNRELSTELILFNPFTLGLEVRQAALAEPGGEPFLEFDRAEINLSLASLIKPGLVFDVVALDNLYLHLQRNSDGTLNISDLIADTDEADTRQEPATEQPFQLTIAELDLSARRIDITDQQHPQGYRTHLDSLSLAVTNLSTVIEEGQPYYLQASTESGGRLEWEGDLSIIAGHSAGALRLDNIRLRPFWRFAEPWLAFEVTSGSLNLDTDYEVSWRDNLHYALSGGSLEIVDVDINPRDTADLPDTGVGMKALRVKGITLDGTQQSVTVEDVAAEGLDLRGWSDGDRVSLIDLFAVSADAPLVSANTEEDSAGPSWQFHLDQAALGDSEINWRTGFTDPPVLTVQPLSASLNDLSWPANGPSPFSLSLTINDTSTLDSSGEINVGSGTGHLDFDLQALSVEWFEPTLPDVLRAEIGSGEAQTSGRLTLKEFQPQTLTGEGGVSKFSMVLHGAEEALTRWQNLDWRGLDVDLGKRDITLAELHLTGYEGRLHIQADGTINVQQLLEEDTDANATSETTTTAPEETDSAQWRFSLPQVFIAKSQLDFQDESLPIPFRTVIGDLDGTITDVGSDPSRPMQIDIKGSVDGYAPVDLSGTASLLSDPPMLDLGLDFRGLDLSRLTPYSSTYAGYTIARGTLNAQLRYRLENGRLQGDNELLIEQLRLGERVASDKAVDLPLKLAIALLTDSNGVIDVAVPVSGDIDNPQFSLASVITRAFVNLIGSAVTAPFRLLANLVGSSEDLQTIDFAAGSATLDDHGEEELSSLATAMQQRPGIALVIEGRFDPVTDRAQLQQQLFRKSLLADGLEESDIAQRSAAWEAAISDRYLALGLAANEETAPSILQQARLLRDRQEVPIQQLRDLAAARAAASKRFLLDEGEIEPGRVVLEQVDPETESHTFSGVELSIDV
ncbi:hypothetical protein CWI75_06640 [Kineobactrum sediminis]|uniref:DUF748 domain-containing protein n=1 Tax=Kineobactrum sediminis TaxID=1905677 RepID=A0A2N5Y3W8_9GAMM|nr:DUF748 domain-containing protein [Kineobactrum sediminis]PLW83093.1 hypothetical protein CWI75_06640 [Kineobactrum sediminis]